MTTTESTQASTTDQPLPRIRRLPPAGSADHRTWFERTGPAAEAHTAYTQGTLALQFESSSPGTELGGPPRLTVLPGGRSRGFGSSPSGLPDARDWAARFVQAIVEVIGGDRPVTQLVRWTAEDVYLDMSRRVRILGLTSTAGSRGRACRPQVASVHVYQPCDDVAEVAVHLRHGARSRAVAARLEVMRGRWLCTALQLA
jgi:uncharacterized protein DUF6459